MSDDLRTRIAAAMYEQRRKVSRVPMLSDWAGAHPTVQEMWLSTADAVIEALKLRQEYDPYSEPESSRHRYVTEWTTDE